MVQDCAREGSGFRSGPQVSSDWEILLAANCVGPNWLSPSISDGGSGCTSMLSVPPGVGWLWAKTKGELVNDRAAAISDIPKGLLGMFMGSSRNGVWGLTRLTTGLRSHYFTVSSVIVKRNQGKPCLSRAPTRTRTRRLHGGAGCAPRAENQRQNAKKGMPKLGVDGLSIAERGVDQVCEIGLAQFVEPEQKTVEDRAKDLVIQSLRWAPGANRTRALPVGDDAHAQIAALRQIAFGEGRRAP